MISNNSEIKKLTATLQTCNSCFLKGIIKSTIVLIPILVVFLTFTQQITAERLESDSYVIQFGNFNMTAGEKESSSYHLTDTVGQTAAGPFGQWGSSSYFVGSGFQYIYQIRQFRFTIDNLNIDLGVLSSNVHNSASNILTINTRGAGGYTVYAAELFPLRHSNGTDYIADTTCDSGTCSETTAQPWIDESVPGFGFNADGPTVSNDFISTNYFRQFADLNNSETMQTIMDSNNIAINDQATITYKAGASGNTPSGKYQTGVVYIAVPGY
ncbi:MAG: hypothetical protein ACOZAN_04440 [Patescibacteria group bacterium]